MVTKSSLNKLFRSLKIRQKLVLVFLPIPFLAVILIGSLWYWNALKAVEKSLGEQTFILAQNASRLVEDYLNERELEIRSVAQLNWIQAFFREANSPNPILEKYQGQSKRLLVDLSGAYFQITCFDTLNQPFAKVQFTSFLPQGELPVHFETAYFDKLDTVGLRESASLVENGIYISGVKSIRGSKAMVFRTPVFDAQWQRKIGSLTFDLPISSVAENVFQNYSLGVTGQAMIVDSDGLLIYHTDRNKINQYIGAAMPYLGQVMEFMLRCRQGTSRYHNEHHETWIVSYSPVKKIRWNVGVAGPVKPFIRSTKQAGLLSLGITLGILLLLLFVINLFSKRFVRAISEVTEGAKAIAAGDLDRRLPIRSEDEIGGLANDFNKMARDLKKMMHEVDIHKNLAAIGQFAASMYHDIKSPLEGIKFLVSGLKRKTQEDDPLKHYVEEIAIGVNNLDQLIRETLDFVKPKSLNFRSVNLNEFLQSVISEINSEGIDIQWKLSNTLPEIELDPVQFKHAVINLVNNAVEAMPDGGTLQIGTELNDESVLLEFVDTGTGISLDKLENIFQPFFSTKARGHGLGLSIAHQIIKNHAGEITVASEVGKGTKVTIGLSLRRDRK